MYDVVMSQIYGVDSPDSGHRVSTSYWIQVLTYCPELTSDHQPQCQAQSSAISSLEPPRF